MTSTPSTVQRIAAETAEHIRLNNETTRGGYDSPHTTESIILIASESILAERIREWGVREAIQQGLDFAMLFHPEKYDPRVEYPPESAYGQMQAALAHLERKPDQPSPHNHGTS